VVDLVGLAGGDQLADLIHGGLETFARRRRHPRAGRRAGDPLVAGDRQRGLLGALEHREPREGERREGVVEIAGPDHEGRVEAGCGLVAHEPGDPEAAPGRGLRPLQHRDDLGGSCRFQDADRSHEPERRRGAGEVVESRLEHMATIRVDTSRSPAADRRLGSEPLRGGDPSGR
jgi:hypothetical protein